RSVNYHIGKRSRYGYYKFFVSEEAKNDLLEYAPIARRKCDTPENHLKFKAPILEVHYNSDSGRYGFFND
ncbi:MAG: hypothetical protein J6L84_06235, partial [Clostridiales bacterium]|nr:hypothetical protein [Clostridiales bacterium]